MPSNYYKQQLAKKKVQQQQRNAVRQRTEAEMEGKRSEEKRKREMINELGFVALTTPKEKKSAAANCNSSSNNSSITTCNNSKANSTSGKSYRNLDDDLDEAKPRSTSKTQQLANSGSDDATLPFTMPEARNSRFLDVSGLRGISNLGNTCFMNAALQALAHITPLRMYFLRTYFRRLRTQADIGADALFDNFLRAMWAPASADKNLVDPYGLTVDTVSPVIAKSLVAFMWKRFPFLHPGEQHDAQEFLRCFLNELHDSLKIVDLRSTGGSLLGHEDGAQENRSDFDSGAIVDGRSSVAADRARARYLANELLAMALSDTQRESRQYRQKVNEFIQLAGSLAEQSSETEDDDEDDDDDEGTCQGRRSGRYRRQHYRSNGELVSGSDSLTASCSTSSDSLHHSCDSACSGANHSGTNSTAGSESSSCHSGVKAPPGGSTYHSHSQHSHQTHGPSAGAASSSSGTFRRASTTSTPGTTSLNCNRIQSRSIISDIFTGELENTIRCTACNSVSVQIESFQDLSIPISIIDKAMHSKYRNPQTLRRLTGSRAPGIGHSSSSFYPFWPLLLGGDLLRFYVNYFWSWLEWLGSLLTAPTVQLDDCLDMFFNPEMLENENRYSCESCQKLCNGVKCIRIKRLPEVLTIHLNRYQNVASSLQKITSNLQFPLVDFNMGKYMAEVGACGENDSPHRGGGTRKADLAMANYELVAVVCHSGSQITNGHYIAYALNDTNFEWYEYDDTRVRNVTHEELLNAAGRDAYILFYQRASADTANTGSPANRSQAAMCVAADMEQMWLERYWKPLQVPVCDPLRDYYLFSQHQNASLTASSGASFFGPSPSSFAAFTQATLNEHSVTLSKYWLNLFLTTMEPGPIDNSDIYCPHRRIRPTEWLYFNTLAVPLIEPVGTFLYALYGGGPTLSRLAGPGDSPLCQCCADQLNQLRYRRSEEFTRFQMLQSVAGLVFKKIKIRKAEAIVQFEMLHDEDDGPDGPGGSKGEGGGGRPSLDIMDSLDDSEIDIELNCGQPIQTDALMTPIEEIGSAYGEEDQDLDQDQEPMAVDEDEETQPLIDHSGDSGTVGETETQPEDEEKVEEGRQIVLGPSTALEPHPAAPVNLYEEYPLEEEPTHYYLISAEWLQTWFNYINVDFGEPTTSRNRQLMAIYEKIATSEASKGAAPPYRRNLNPFETVTCEEEYAATLPHPPFSSLLKPSDSAKMDGGGSSAGSKHFEMERLWSQIDFNLHTIVPPGPIDNWSLFGVKRKLLSELKKKGKKGAGGGAAPETPTLGSYNDLVSLLGSCLGSGGGAGEGPPADVRSLSSESPTGSGWSGRLPYSFNFTSRLHGGLSEESRSCAFYFLSPEYWDYFCRAYGGGPVLTYDYTAPEQKFTIQVGVSDVEHFIRHHYKGSLGAGLLGPGTGTETPNGSVQASESTGGGGQLKRSCSMGNRCKLGAGAKTGATLGLVEGEDAVSLGQTSTLRQRRRRTYSDGPRQN